VPQGHVIKHIIRVTVNVCYRKYMGMRTWRKKEWKM